MKRSDYPLIFLYLYILQFKLPIHTSNSKVSGTIEASIPKLHLMETEAEVIPPFINFTSMPARITTKDLMERAKDAESEQKLEQAAEIYEQILKDDNLEVEAYDRLLIVYRKLKDYKNELVVLDRGIKAYQDFYNSKTSKSKKVIDLSTKLAKSIGLVDKKGNTTYDPEPIGKWKKRRLVIEKKLKPKKKKA